MNLVIICGKVISKVEFNFIYDRYSVNEEILDNKKYDHTSLARCKLKLLNGSIVEIYGYDDTADFMYRYLKENDNVLLEGKIDSNMKIFLYRLNYNIKIRKI